MKTDVIDNENWIEYVANYLAVCLNQNLSLNELEFLKMKLGLEVILINITKGIVIYGLAIILNVFLCTALLHGSYLVIRNKSFGLHARSSLMCTMISILLFVIIPLWGKDIILNQFMIFIVFFVSFCCLFRYAPADTEKLPLIGVKKRERLRLKSVIRCALLGLIAWCFSESCIGTMITFGVGIQVVFILPITYKVLKRSCNNYEQYETKLS